MSKQDENRRIIIVFGERKRKLRKVFDGICGDSLHIEGVGFFLFDTGAVSVYNELNVSVCICRKKDGEWEI